MSKPPNRAVKRRCVTAAYGLAAVLLQSACAQEQGRLVDLALAEIDVAEERLEGVAELHRTEQEYFRERRARIPPCPAEAPEAAGMELYNCRWYAEELREMEESLQTTADSYDAAKLEEVLTTVRRTIRSAPVEELRELLDYAPNQFDNRWVNFLRFAWVRAPSTPGMKWFAQRWTHWSGPFWPSTAIEQQRETLKTKRREFDQAESNLQRTLAALP